MALGKHDLIGQIFNKDSRDSRINCFKRSYNKGFFSRRDGPCSQSASQSVSQSVSEVCLFVTPIRFEVLSEPMKLQFIKGK